MEGAPSANAASSDLGPTAQNGHVVDLSELAPFQKPGPKRIRFL
jgi:hypothetical protein